MTSSEAPAKADESDAGLAGTTPDPGLDPSDAATRGPRRDAGSGDDAAVASGCNLTGRFAVSLEAQVSWAGTTLFEIVPIITPGVGTLELVVLADLTDDGGKRSADIRACGASTPDFASIVSETYGVEFPDPLWAKLMEHWLTPVSTSCAAPGCSLSTDRVEAQLGIDLPEALPWPGPRDPIDVAYLRDGDADNVPGIMVRARGAQDVGSVKYTHPPLDALLTQRASELMLAIRIGAQLSGKIDSCDEVTGGIPSMSIDTRALACQLDSGARCSSDQVDFVDDNLPVWKVTGSRFRAVRVPANSSCAQARARVQL